MGKLENAVIIPQSFTGRDPVVVVRSAVRGFDLGADLRVGLSEGRELQLAPEGELTPGRIDELCAILFGPELGELSGKISKITGTTRRWVNPENISSIELFPTANGQQTIRVSLAEGRPLNAPYSDFVTYKRLIELIYGREFARGITPWVQSAPPSNVLEMARSLVTRRKQRDDEAAAERAQAEQAASKKALSSRYVQAT